VSVKRDWERILEREGLGANLKPLKPVPRIDRNWTKHFRSRHDAYSDAIARLQLDAQTTSDLFSLLTDIRWGHHSSFIAPLTPEEHKVVDPYCAGLTFEQIGAQLDCDWHVVERKFFKALSRFTTSRPTMKHASRRRKNESK
jgi:hypothetical protein